MEKGMKNFHRTPILAVVITILIGPLLASLTNYSEECDLVDVVFLIPASNDVSKTEIGDLKRMLLFLFRGMPVAESETRIGVVPYGSKAGDPIHLSGDRMLLGRSVLSLQAVGGSSNLSEGLKMTQRLLSKDKRYAVPRVAVVVYKNVTAKSITEAKRQTTKMAEDDVRLITIGIGSRNLGQLAWAEDLTYNLTFTRDLVNITRDIQKYICKAINTPKPHKGTSLKLVAHSTTPNVLEEQNDENEEMLAICSKASWLNGAGYASVEGYPEKFAMCYRGLNDVMTVSYKTCPFGQQWSEKDMTCIQSYRQETTTENNQLCQLAPVPGRSDKFRQRTAKATWLEFDCPDGTAFSEENCGCSIFRTAQYMAKQQQGLDSCNPELYLPFCDDLKDFSGKDTYVQRVGHVRVREGKAYFDGTSSLFIPRFSGIEYGDTVVIQLTYLAEDEDDNAENNIDPNNDDPEFSLISNGICHDETCETPSVTIRSKMGETIFQTSSTIDDVTIVSEHSRRKRDTEDLEEELSVLESLITEDSNMNKDDIILQENILSSNDSQDVQNSQEILNDVQHDNQDEIENNIADEDNKSQVQNNPFLSIPLGLLTDSTDNDFDIILEPIDIDFLIPTTTVKTPTLVDDFVKITDSDDNVLKKGDIVRDKLEKIDDDSGTPDEDHVPNYDIILNSTDESNIIDDVKGFNSGESVGDIDTVQNKVNFDIIFDNSGNEMDDLIDDIKGIVKNNGIKDSDDRNEESKNVNDNSEDIDNEIIYKVENNNKDSEDFFKSQDDNLRGEKENSVDELSFHPKVKSGDRVDDHDNNTDSEEEDTSGVQLIQLVDGDVKDDISKIEEFQLDSSIDTSKEDLNDSTKDLILNYTESDDKNKEMQISVGDDNVDISQAKEDTSDKEEETDNVYFTDSTSEESNETGISVDTEYDISSGEVNYDDTSKDKDVLSVKVKTNESSRTDSSKDTKKKAQWKTVTLKIKDGVMQASVDGRREDEKYFRGRIKPTQSGFHIGSGTGGNNFKGYIDEVSGRKVNVVLLSEVYIYLCDPHLETEEEKYRRLLHERRQHLSADHKVDSWDPKCDYLNPKAQDWLQERK